MKQFEIKNYNAENSWFKHYYKHNPRNPVGNVPEHITYEIKPLIPDYITTIINFGCANGRDFIPFQDKYNLVGFDLVKGDYIEWVCDTTNLIYYQCSMEDFMEPHNIDVEDLSTSLVYTNVSLFYLEDKQEEFITYLLNKKCQNMVFQEYKNSFHGHFQPGKHKDLFKERQFNRKDVTGFIYLDKF
tara:strand:- start:2203 stop:2760 length:558 start_codon:yes stop_codon:yes gene_type:complete